MTSEKVKLFCILDGDSTAFPVKVATDESVGDLKDAIREKKPNDLQDVDADTLILWHVSIPSTPKRQITLGNLTDEEKATKKPEELEDPTIEISEVFGLSPAKRTIHVIVKDPRQATVITPAQTALSPSPPISRPTSPSQDLETTIKKITARFFANDSPTAIFLNDYVKGANKLPLTTQGIKGLP
ncbi:hypothetical protein BGZ79_002908, partial [Entomortierella chlamydospora]